MKKWRRPSRTDNRPLTSGFLEECLKLAPLETFDPEAFRGDAEVPQEICNFVLALALIYNDCKDAIYAHVALGDLRPAETPQRNRIWGAISGAQLHIFRAVAALLHELFQLIERNRQHLDHEFFVALVQRLHPKQRGAWTALVDVACDRAPTNQLGKKLVRLRNKVLFHYDPEEIFRGYRHHFLEPTKVDVRAYVSRGGSMRGSRFYFADAAVAGYLHSLAGAEPTGKLAEDIADVLDQVNLGLMMIVRTYIQRRGTYRLEAEQ